MRVFKVNSNKDSIKAPRRRALLKWLLFGAGAFAIGKLWNSDWNPLYEPKVLSEKFFRNFKFVETTEQMTLFDKEGDEVLVIDKD